MEVLMTGTENELMDERYELVMDRIKETMGEDAFGEPLLSLFHTCSSWLIFLSKILERSLAGKTGDIPTEDLAAENHKLYEDILPEHYAVSFSNPDHAVSEFEKANIPNGKKLAQYLSFTYAELRGLIGYAFEGQKEIFTIFAELYAQIYTSFRFSALDGSYPDPEGIRDIIYWFERDNCDVIIPENVSDKVDASNDHVRKIVCDADLDDERFLYLSGEYVTENEKGIAKFLNTLSEDEIKSMADTFTE